MEESPYIDCENEAILRCECFESTAKVCTSDTEICDEYKTSQSLANLANYVREAESQLFEIHKILRTGARLKGWRPFLPIIDQQKILNELDENINFFVEELKTVSKCTYSKCNLVYSIKKKYNLRKINAFLQELEHPQTKISFQVFELKVLISEHAQEYSCKFLQFSKILEKTNNITMKSNHSNIDTLPEDIGYLGGICNLSNSRIFYCGGFTSNGNYLSCCYVFDIYTFEWEKLASLPSRRNNVIPLQIGNFVYIFGGHNVSGNIALVSRYSFEDDAWVNLRDIPIPSRCVSSVHVCGNILITGMDDSNIYLYNITENNFSIVLSNTSTKSNAALLVKTQSGDLFYFSKGNIFKSHETDYANWYKVCSFKFNIGNIENQPQAIGEYICFTLWPNIHIRFNLKTFEIEKYTIDY